MPETIDFEQQKLRQDYSAVQASYERLAINLQQALKGFLEEASISHLAISYRVKEFSSFAEKIKRKGYEDPFTECEDLCGLRIICYYPADIEKICQIIEREFDVQQNVNKAALSGVQEFGYRSTHFIVTVNKRWLVAPNYRGLDNLKAEIQVRTTLMHAWAEIEHKLAYKKQEQVPNEFRRKLSRLSAKFEEADEQFEELKNGLQAYREKLAEEATETGRFDETLDLNLDSLRAFLDFRFPDREKGQLSDVRELLDELTSYKLTMKDIVRYYDSVAEFLTEFEDEIVQTSTKRPYWTQEGALRAVLLLSSKDYLNRYNPKLLKGKKGEIITRARTKLRGK